jgi:hypothetical protein
MLVESIKEQLKDDPPGLIVVDTLNRSLVGSESHDEDMARYIAAVAKLVEAFGCLAMIVHHCGIDGTRPRGHTALTAAVDAQLAVDRDSATDNVVVTLEYLKDGPGEGDKIASRLEVIEVGEDPDGDQITSCVVIPVEAAPSPGPAEPRLSKNQRTMFDLLHSAGAAGLTLADWYDRARAVGIGVKRKADLYDIRSSLTSKGLVREYGDRWHVNHGGDENV